MKNYGLFDILGPTMIGPSSSHTAGACRIGKMARKIYERPIHVVNFYLHGSFAETYRGHGTDKALLAGVMGCDPDDEKIVNAMDYALQENIEYRFLPKDLGFVHPNTVKIEFIDENGKAFYIIGSSIGGGNIEIININGIEVHFTGEYPTIIATYHDRNGMIADISIILTQNKINIAQVKVTREIHQIATMVMELDSPYNESIIDGIQHTHGIIDCLGIMPL